MKPYMYLPFTLALESMHRKRWNEQLAREAIWVARCIDSIDRPNQLKSGHTLYMLWKRRYKGKSYTDPVIYSVNALYIIDSLSNVGIWSRPT